MRPYHRYAQLVLVGLLWLCVRRPAGWPSQDAVSPPPPLPPGPPQWQRKRSTERMAPCAHTSVTIPRRSRQDAPRPGRRLPAARVASTPPGIAARMRTVPIKAGWGKLRANGQPSGGPWRPLYCPACAG
jgi:hypothetical protein